MRLIVFDGYDPDGRKALVESGATEAGELFRRELARFAPDVTVDVAYAAEDARVPFADCDGVIWTGSSLSVLDVSDRYVSNQIDLAGAVHEAGVPAFGSCWGAQVSAVAAGGRCRRSPKGREFGVGRRITLNDAGRAHPMFAGRNDVFDVLTCHADEIEVLPDESVLLASNDFSRVQGIGIGRFWAVQYHPEYDLHEIACLARLRGEGLVARGRFKDAEEVGAWADGLERLHADPAQPELARELEIPTSVLDPDVRTLELRNWVTSLQASAGS
jgi:GMP synthase (glutamine-hydrolysing)